MRKSKKVIFKGWDWSELGPALLNKTYSSYAKKYRDDEDCFKKDEVMLKDLREAMWAMMWEIADSRPEVRREGLKKIKAKLQHVRNFVKAVVECEKGGYRYSLIKGLYDTKDNYTFLSYTSLLLDSLWT